MTKGFGSAYAVGVDGCRAGWFAAWLDADGTIQGEIYKTVADLVGVHPSADSRASLLPPQAAKQLPGEAHHVRLDGIVRRAKEELCYSPRTHGIVI